LIESVEFEAPAEGSRFNFEKVSKRTFLDIASVNTALRITTDADGGTIERVHLSAGGIGPVPAYLRKTAESLAGEVLAPGTIRAAARVMDREITPISDVRGSAEYKALLLRQLFFAHFLELFPGQFNLEELVS
jgi:xanthine dehydrogenase small subunit